MKQTFEKVSICDLPNGGVAVMAKDGTMLAYAKVKLVGTHQKYDWQHKNF